MNLEVKLQKRLRFLTQGLFVSGFLNIFLVIVLAYFSVSKRHLIKKGLSSIKKYEKQKQNSISNSRYLNAIYSRSFKELLVLLTSKELLEEGFAKRDFALGCLYTFCHFNLEKALPGKELEKRTYNFLGKGGEPKTVVLFAGLSDDNFNDIIHYGCSEKWPFTSEGLFNFIKNSAEPIDVSLLKAFAVTEEFYVLSTLFQGQIDFQITPMQLINLIKKCRFSFLENFVKEQKQLLKADLKERRSLFLMGCLEEGADEAAFLLVRGNLSYLLKKVTDVQLLKILYVLQKPSNELYQLCLELVKSPRSNAVWEKSAQKLYLFVQEKPPEPFSREIVLRRFAPGYLKQQIGLQKAENTYANNMCMKKTASAQQSKIKQMPNKIDTKTLTKPANTLKTMFRKIVKNPELYIVQKGDSLWKIAHRRQIKVSDLMQANNLKNSKVKPGQKLKIPKK